VTVLVTGGAGYIGSHTVRALRETGRDVVVLDTLELGRQDALLGAPLVVGDIADEALVREVCGDHQVTSTIHFAAYKSVGESMVHPGKYWQNNVAGSVHLAEALTAAGVRDVVFSSSCSVMGNPDAVPVREDAAIRPESVYAETKATMERIFGWYGVTKGLRVVSLRYFNAAGASHDGVIGEDWTYSVNLIPLVMKATLGKRPPVQVFGDDYPTPDGTAIRDYIHVEDLADAHIRAVDYLAQGGASRAFNIGTGVGTSVMEVIRTTQRVSGQPVPYEIVSRRAGDPMTIYADPSAAAADLGWTPKFDLDDIITTAWRWHSSQR
jgi:UDP-glucose-4-epimerase GalE